MTTDAAIRCLHITNEVPGQADVANWKIHQVTTTGGGSTDDGSTDGGTGSGEVMFWTSSDMECGNISVTCAGSTKTITGYYSSGVPDCGASSSATFTLNPGSHGFTAKCTSQTWAGTVTVAADGCSTMQLTN